MGTPDFAAKSLERLFRDGRDVVGVFTQPDKPKNRGMKTVLSPVKTLALERGAPIYQPPTLRNGAALELLGQLRPN
jgi:methionyl-tRNA formyltransferase